MDRRKEEFKNPGMHYRSRPFWAWNGKLSEKELYRQLDVLKEMGFGGAFIHSRVGLETEYMGQEWMQLVDRCLTYGKKIGLEMWIYDEDRWPSGTAGGIVTEKEKNRTHRIQMRIFSQEEADLILQEEKQGDKEKIIAAFQCRLDGHYFQDLRIYHSGPEAENSSKPTEKQAKAADDKVLIFSICESSSNDNYNGYTYLDTMNREAVKDFLDATQDRYEKELTDEGLSCLQGFFTDEPHRGAYLCDFSEGNTRSIPYTEGLFKTFKDRYGYELPEKLPSLFLREKGENCSYVALDYLELTQELFLENYMVPYRERCHEYGQLFTGHLLHEDSLSTQTCMMGSLMTGYEYMDIPGIDLLGERTNCWWIGKQLSSVAHQTGKKQMLSELYGCTGWQMRLEDYKAVGDWQAMMGIDLFCPHLCWYTMKGENKRDFPASIFYQSAWYKEYADLEDYFARIHMCTEGDPADCHLLVLNPIRSVWARTYSECFTWLLSNDPGIDRIEKQYEETFRVLMGTGIDFDYGEERILQQYGSVKNGSLLVGECSYDCVLLSGVETIEETTWALLTDFANQGGKVIVAGEGPSMIRARKDARVETLMALAERIPFEREAVIKATRPTTPLYALENHGDPVYVQAYKKEEQVTFILLNMDREHPAENVELHIYKEGKAEEWNARTGGISGLELSGDAGVRKLFFQLAPGEEKIIQFNFFTQEVTRETADNSANYQTNKSTRDQINDPAGDPHISHAEVQSNPVSEKQDLYAYQKEFRYQCTEPNIAVLDRAAVYLEEQLLIEGEEILREDRILRKKLGMAYRGGEMMQPWYIEKYRPEKLRERKDVKAVFTFYVTDPENMPQEIFVAAELEEDTREKTQIYLNGHRLRPGKEFWIDPAFKKCRINREMLKKGKNEISLKHLYGQDSGLEAVYLLGNFGVELLSQEKKESESVWKQSEVNGSEKQWEIGDSTKQENSKAAQLVYLTPMPQKLTAASITEQGFPFYSGSIIYELAEDVRRKLRGTVQIEFSDLPAALAVLHGAEKKRILFAPYRAKVCDLQSIEMIFNRRNTFGPLHLPVEYKGNYGPETFVTEKEAWRDAMQLIPQGLPRVITFQKEC